MKTAEEQKEFLSWFLNEDKNCVLWEQLHSWIEDTLEIIIPGAPANFIRAIHNSLDMEEMRDMIFSFVEHEDGTSTQGIAILWEESDDTDPVA